MSERRPGGYEPPNHEILHPDDWSGLQGRLYLASKSPAEAAQYINLDSTVKVPDALNHRKRKYTQITHKLSVAERTQAWDGMNFDDAYKAWSEGLTKRINGFKPEDAGKLDALRLIMSEERRATLLTFADFAVEDAKELYDTFCKNGESNTDEIIKRAVASASVDPQKLANIEWVAGNLFGEQTAEAVSRMIELEVKVRNRPHNKTVKEAVFHDPTRVNNLNPEEKEILKHLYNGLDARPSTSGTTEVKKPVADAAAAAGASAPVAEPKVARSDPVIKREPKPVTPQKNSVAIELEGQNLAKDLNINLLNQASPDAIFSIPIEVLKEYLTSIAGDKLKSPGNIILNKDKNEITIRGLRIDGGFLGGKISLDLLITNSSKGISAQVQNYNGRGMARGTVEDQVAALDIKFKEIIYGLVATQNPVWRPNNIVIAGDRIKIGFHNTSVSKGTEPTPPAS